MDTTNKDNNVECKLIPCTICKMFCLTTPDELLSWVGSTNSTGEMNMESITMTCSRCIEKENLQRYIKTLQSKIKYLNNRVASLRSIRDFENSIDDSINQLADQFDSFHVTNNNSNILPDGYAEKVTILDCTDASQLDNSNGTSIWDDTSSIFDNVLNGLQEKTQPIVVTDTLVKEPILINDSDPILSDISVVSSKQSENCPSQLDNHDDCTTNINVDSVTHQSYHSEKTFLSENYCEHIKLLVIGDENLSPFHVQPTGTFTPDVMFKVASPNALLDDLVETANFFLEKFPNVETVVFHGGTTVMKRGKTEKIKGLYTKLIDQTKSKNINLVLSGPFPNLCMSPETFSRTVAINQWLNNVDDHQHLSIASHFESFLGKTGMIYPYSYKLTSKGAKQLTANIQECLH